MLLSDRVAIVTGGARGIGRGIALKFADEGCSVAIVDVLAKEANDTVAEVSQKGGKGIAIKCDVSQSRQVQDMVDKVISTFGNVDILVNNAGILPAHKMPVTDVTEELWDKVMAVNLKGGFLCCKAVTPYMKEKKYGKIINVSSLGAKFPPAPTIYYHAAKAGVLGMTYDLACELAAYNICVNAILPGFTRTPLQDIVVESIADKEAYFLDFGKKNVPMQRVGTPEDIAGVAVFLASELSAFVTGETIIVAGGMPLKPAQL